MPNYKRLEILKQGVEVWNRWKRENPPNPYDMTVEGFNGVDFRGEDFRGADFSSELFARADFDGANLKGVSFRGANLTKANLRVARLAEADMSGADLTLVNLSGATMLKADLSRASLWSANFSDALLFDSNFTEARAHQTIFSNNDLRTVKGLSSVRHAGPSYVDISTIYLSEGNIPETFLRGCGLPENFITYLRSLVSHPIEFYSCFISYSSKNQLFADRLYADLQNKGVRCWLASEDLKIGEKLRVGIDESIRFHDKLLLVLSRHSVASDWVEQEVETALDRERKERRTVLFPIRLDDAVMKVESGWPALVKNTRNIGDFRKWSNVGGYQKALDKLLHDLKAEDMEVAGDKTKGAKGSKKRLGGHQE